MARGEFAIDLGEGALHQFGIFFLAGDRYRLHRAKERPQQRQVVNLVIHHEAHRAMDTAEQDLRIHETHVIAHDQRSAAIRHMLESGYLDAVQRVDQDPVDEAQQEFRYQGVDVYRDDRVEQRGDEKQLWNREMQRVEQCERQRCRRNHEQCVDDVVTGDDAREMVAFGAALHEREQRHDIEAGKHADQSEIERNVPTARRMQEFERPQSLRGRWMRTREIQVDAEQGDADRAERHEADLDFVSRQALA